MDAETLRVLVRAQDYGRSVVQVGLSHASYSEVITHSKRAVAPAKRFYAASIAKQMVVVCAGLLEAEGALRLQDTIGSRVSGLRDWAEGVTLLDCVHHVAGLPNQPPDFKPKRQRTWTSDKAMAAMRRFAVPAAAKGAQFSYSSLGYVLLTAAIEQAAREPLASFATRRIFAPMKMHSTEFFSGPGRAPTEAFPTDRRIAAPLSIGDGGLWTTAPDLLAWGRAMNVDFFGLASLSRRSAILNDGNATQYGGGVRQVMVGNHVGYSHGGSWPGATSKLLWVPETSLVLAILSTTDETKAITDLYESILSACAY